VLVLRTTTTLVLCTTDGDLEGVVDVGELVVVEELEELVVLELDVDDVEEEELVVVDELVVVVLVSVGNVGSELGVVTGVGVAAGTVPVSTACLLNKAPSPSCISGKYGEAEVWTTIMLRSDKRNIILQEKCENILNGIEEFL
jgi:hypothetical protein